MQNTTHAVMAQRAEPKDSRDDFPTPPWATRALIEHVIGPSRVLGRTCIEPACGAGHMSQPLAEYFAEVRSYDAHPYGFGKIRDFLTNPYEPNAADWVITNPPFRLAQEFIQRGLSVAKEGVAVLVRTVFIESVGRYVELFSKNPPQKFAQFVERVPMVRGRLDAKATTATGYAWLVWDKRNSKVGTELIWIPPCRRGLERKGDYHRL